LSLAGSWSTLQRIPAIAALITIGSLLELGRAALGTRFNGLSIGFVIALYLEGLYMARAVYRSAVEPVPEWQSAHEAALSASSSA
jgi:hypothetical protein